MDKLSAIIITKNEEANIEDCLKSVSWADEIILVDDESDDRTVDIASTYPHVKIFIRRMKDGFGPQKQYALEQSTSEWVLSLDADERITEKCREEIINMIEYKEFDGFYFKRRNLVFGRFIHDSKAENLRLFRRTKGQFSSAKVHESVIVDGKIGTMNEPIIHYSKTTQSVEDYIRSLNLYTTLSAQDLYSKGRRITVLTFIPYFFFHPLYVFCRFLLLRGHWRDGVSGLLMSLMRVLDTIANYIKLLEIQTRLQRGENYKR